MSRPLRFALIGPGRVGLALARKLTEGGHSLVALRSSGPVTPEALAFLGFEKVSAAIPTDCDLLLITVPDDRIRDTVVALHSEGVLRDGQTLIHCSGLQPAALLREAAPGVALRTLSLHPLMTFPGPEQGYAALSGCPWAVEGDDDALIAGEQLVRDLGGQPFRLASAHKALYHAAAVIACNYSVALAATGRDLMAQALDFPRDAAWTLLLPLLQRTWDNLSRTPPEAALTGPIARGDTATVQRHLDALPEDLRSLYRALGRATLELVSEGPEKAELTKLLMDQDR